LVFDKKVQRKSQDFYRIQLSVKRALICCFVFLATAFASSGSFVGEIVNGPKLDTSRKWVFVQGPRGSSRKVDITTATISFSPDVPKRDREAPPENAVREGAQVRVTASQDDDGDWKASAVEVIKTAPR